MNLLQIIPIKKNLLVVEETVQINQDVPQNKKVLKQLQFQHY